MKSKSGLWIIIGIGAVILIGLIFAFSGGSDTSSEQSGSASGSLEIGGDSEQVVEEQEKTDEGNNENGNAGNSVWLNTELTDVRTGESFRISDFEGKPILLETFAVWCPTCTRQQEKIKDFHEEPGYSEEDVVSISLNVDPSEDEERVREHIERNGFHWRYAVSPEGATQSLIEDFGVGITSAPSVPMVLICGDLSHRKLGGFGVRSVDELKEEIAAGC